MASALCIMVLPSTVCQAKCAYCFGPNQGSVMPHEVFDQTMDWLEHITAGYAGFELVFHGGEPLIAGHAWFERSLAILRGRFGARVRLHCQSNFWLLDDAFCELFSEYGVSLGTSLDGPEHLNDPQRGAGYFARTMAGIETAKQHGIVPGVVCTFTRRSVPHASEILAFFRSLGLPVSVHGAVGAQGRADQPALALTPEEYARLMVSLFDQTLQNGHQPPIPTFERIAKSISAGQAGLCTFSDCLGAYLTVAPDGGIFTCNRFVDDPDWRVGWVHDRPGIEALAESPAWKQMETLRQHMRAHCGGCAHTAYCRGGCPYQALSTGADPYCPAYRQLFGHIVDRALDELFSTDNIEAVLSDGPGKNGWLRKGTLLEMMSSD